MKNTEREQIKNKYIKIIQDSWTYEKLSGIERKTIIQQISRAKLYANNGKNICEELNTIYYTYLLALEYEPIGWRETPKEKQITNNLF